MIPQAQALQVLKYLLYERVEDADGLSTADPMVAYAAKTFRMSTVPPRPVRITQLEA